MPVIKRYANRKLYDTDAKHYVTLEDLANFIRKGEEVQVVDYNTGEDLTSLTLLQVIFEEEKKMGVLFPQVFLTRMIRAGGDTVNTLRSRLASLDPFQVVDDEIHRRVQALADQERITPEEATRLHELLGRRPAVEEGVRIPVKDEGAPVEEPVDPLEVETLMRQVGLLEQQLEELKKIHTGGDVPLEDTQV